MSRHFDFEDMSTGYLELVSVLKKDGRRRSPRGFATSEIPNLSFTLADPRLSHPVGIGRRYGRAIAAAEALGLIGGVTDPELMCKVGANFSRFLDGGTLHGAYGPRVRGQLPNVVERLSEDPDTRQAVLQVWDAKYDQAGWTPRDLPCTLSFGFAIYGGKLEMTATMRSNDIWWGLAHDTVQFTALQLTVASALGLPAGPYTHQAYSLHLYDRDLEETEKLHPQHLPDYLRHREGGICSLGGIHVGMARARALYAGERVPAATESEIWYEDTLKPYLEA